MSDEITGWEKESLIKVIKENLSKSASMYNKEIKKITICFWVIHIFMILVILYLFSGYNPYIVVGSLIFACILSNSFYYFSKKYLLNYTNRMFNCEVYPEFKKRFPSLDIEEIYNKIKDYIKIIESRVDEEKKRML